MTRAELEELPILIKKRATYEERIMRLRVSILRTTPQLDGMPHGGQQRDLMAEYAARLDALERQLMATETEINARIQTIEETVRRLPMRQCAVVWMRYVDNMSWEKIARELHYSKRNLYYLHRDAIKTLKGFH